MCAQSSAQKLYEDDEGEDNKKRKESRIAYSKAKKDAYSIRANPRIHDKRDSRCRRPPQKKEKQETVVQWELNSSKIAVTGRNKRSDKSSTKSCDKEIAPRRHGEKFESRSSTKKETEKMQAITGRFAAC